MESLNSFLLKKSFTPDSFGRAIQPHPNEAMPVAAGDFETHGVTNVVIGALSCLSFGIIGGIYWVISQYKSYFKSQAFAQLGARAAYQQPEEIGDEKYKITYSREPYGEVVIED